MAVDVDKMMISLKDAAARFGVEIGDRKKTYNSRLAQEVGLWAEQEGKGHAFHMQAFKAYFKDGKNLADKSVLQDLMDAAGLDRLKGESVIDNRTFSNAVDADWELSRQSNITAVPTFVFGFSRLVGAQSYAALEKLVTAR